MFEFKPLLAQPCNDVLFFNARACASNLFETAQQRMSAVLDLVHMIEQCESQDLVKREAARLSFVIGLLLDDARMLYEAAHARAMEDAGSAA